MIFGHPWGYPRGVTLEWPNAIEPFLGDHPLLGEACTFASTFLNGYTEYWFPPSRNHPVG